MEKYPEASKKGNAIITPRPLPQGQVKKAVGKPGESCSYVIGLPDGRHDLGQRSTAISLSTRLYDAIVQQEGDL